MRLPLAPARLTLIALLAVAALAPAQAPPPPLNAASLRAALDAKPTGKEAEALADRIREWLGKDEVKKGTQARIEGLYVVWAVEAPGAKAPPSVASEDGLFRLPMQRVGETNFYALAATLADDSALKWSYDVDGKRQGGGQIEVYNPDPDSYEKPGVPKGKLIANEGWKSKVFAGTVRDWWIYVPAACKPAEPAALVVFQDGGGMKEYGPTALDNLTQKKVIPPTVGVFINPGVMADDSKKSNRSFEYDTLSDQYARFLVEEILPEVEKVQPLTKDPALRALAGISSGGICAFTAAWERPDQFARVISFVGSFTNIASGKTLREGGHNYPSLIRKTPKKDIRVFLQDGENDLDNEHGSWPLANMEMDKALAFAGYDHKLVMGHGFHSGNYAKTRLPETLRWIWPKAQPAPAAAAAPAPAPASAPKEVKEAPAPPAKANAAPKPPIKPEPRKK